MRLYTILNKLSTLVNQHTEQISSLNSKTTASELALNFDETQTIFSNNASREYKIGNSVIAVKLDGQITNTASNWTTIATGLPSPVGGRTFNCNILTNAGNVIRVRVTGSGTLDIAAGYTGNIGTSFVYIAG